MSRYIDADALIDGYRHMGYDPSEHPEESYMEGWCKGFNSAVDHCIHHAIHAPTINPKRKKGEWIYGEKDGQDGWYCSECGGFIPWYYDFYGLDHSDFIKDFLVCPFCDTKMDSEGAEYDNPG